ncbi:NAD-dependent epimerase/dehydratase family protein [Herbaspirillum sp. NPDC087042]|uniref:NAD-dependent epimerase/dehydratase family protein n=1 Tax=Herbaspirillum sp. NPDC087042 TaxID=3364004 RepID=UPI003807AED8
MKILVTGGTGFLGRHLVWRLAGQGHDVSFTGRDHAHAQLVMRAAPAGLSGTMRFCALEHGRAGAGERLRHYAAGAQAMVHCAGLAAPWGSPSAFHAANVASTMEVLSACRDHGIGKLVHISTPSLYFRFADCVGIGEDEPLPPPVNDYARTKWQAEQLVQASGLSQWVILRPRAIFGPWDNTLLPRLLRLAQRGPVPLLRGGNAWLDLSYVDNVVDAVVLGLRHAGPVGTYNISNGEPIEAARLFVRLGEAFGIPIRTVHRSYTMADMAARGLEAWARIISRKEPVITRYSLGAIAFSQTLDLTRARAELGYEPGIGLDEAIIRTAAWWKAQARS